MQFLSFPELSGVVQGSVVGPTLFLLFIVELASLIKTTSSFFADDTKFFGLTIEATDAIQKDLQTIFDWTKDWLLTLNVDKCTVLHMGKRNPRRQIT